jgi:16S rRNA (cytidine1402-2'-O)-methyltransferase
VGTLYLVSTPIGNLEDITHRAIRILNEVDLIAAEDTRHTRKILDRYDIDTAMLSYHEHSKETRVLSALSDGDVALVSDAGTPGLSDPGYPLISEALANGHQIVPIPGPSAVVAALAASGLPTDEFRFVGFLPRRSSPLGATLEGIAKEQATVVAFEAPHRVRKTLTAMDKILGSDRLLVVCRELTKLHEEILRGTVAEIRQHFEQTEPRGEFTLVIAGASGSDKWTEQRVRDELESRLNLGHKLSETASAIAAESGWTKSDVYRLGAHE